MKTALDRRALLWLTVAGAVAPSLPAIASPSPLPRGLSPLVAERRLVLIDALRTFESAAIEEHKLWHIFEQADTFADERQFWAAYGRLPTRIAYTNAKTHAQRAAEAVFMTPPKTAADENVIVETFDDYFTVADSWFWAQCARDLFTPLSHIPARSHKAYLSIREGLLTDPDEMFVKSNVPPFVWDMREKHRLGLL